MIALFLIIIFLLRTVLQNKCKPISVTMTLQIQIEFTLKMLLFLHRLGGFFIAYELKRGEFYHPSL